MLKNLDQLNLMLGSLKKPFSVIGISETWLTDCTAELVNTLDTILSQIIANPKQVAELAFIYKTTFNTNFLNAKCQIQRQLSLYLWRLQFPIGKTSLLDLCIDRQINNTAFFLDKFNDILSRISKDNKQCYVMGDFNLDLLQYNHHTPTQEFIDTIFARIYSSLLQSNAPHLLFCNPNR